MSKTIVHEDSMNFFQAGRQDTISDDTYLSILTNRSSQEMIEYYWRKYFKYIVIQSIPYIVFGVLLSFQAATNIKDISFWLFTICFILNIFMIIFELLQF